MEVQQRASVVRQSRVQMKIEDRESLLFPRGYEARKKWIFYAPSPRMHPVLPDSRAARDASSLLDDREKNVGTNDTRWLDEASAGVNSKG